MTPTTRLFWFALLCWAGAILWLSSLTPQELPDAAFIAWDKVNHFLAYAVGGWLAAGTLRLSRPLAPVAGRMVLAVILVAAFGIAGRPHDPRAFAGIGCRHDVDLAHRGHILAVPRVDKNRAAHLDLIAAGKLCPLDLAAVEPGAVRAFQVAHNERIAHPANLGMPSGDLVVVQLDEVARLSADAHGPFVAREVVAGAAIAALDHEEGRHGEAPRGLNPSPILPAAPPLTGDR